MTIMFLSTVVDKNLPFSRTHTKMDPLTRSVDVATKLVCACKAGHFLAAKEHSYCLQAIYQRSRALSWQVRSRSSWYRPAGPRAAGSNLQKVHQTPSIPHFDFPSLLFSNIPYKRITTITTSDVQTACCTCDAATPQPVSVVATHSL